MSTGKHCSVHETCMWELSLEAAKANADTAVRHLWAAEARIARLEAALKDAVDIIHSEFCGSKCSPTCLEMKRALKEPGDG